MADKKITELGTATIVDTDLLAVVHDPSGTPATVKATIAAVLALGGGSGGGLALLEQHAASTSASLDFTTGITSAYDDYLLEILGLVPDSNAASLSLKLSTDGGSTFLGGTGYGYRTNYKGTGGDDSSIINTAAAAFNLGGYVAEGGDGAFGKVQLWQPLRAAGHYLRGCLLFHHDSNSALYEFNSTMFHSGTTPVNALRLAFDIGNILSGTARLYGIAK